MKNFRGRITRNARGTFIVDDSDSEYSDSEVEAVFTPGNLDLVLNEEIFLEGGEEGGGEEDISEDSSPSEDEEMDIILDFAPVDEEFEEDVSMEGFFAFGGRLSRDRRRTRSIDSNNTNNNTAPVHSPLSDTNNQAVGEQGAGSSGSSGGGSFASTIPLPTSLDEESTRENGFHNSEDVKMEEEVPTSSQVAPLPSSSGETPGGSTIPPSKSPPPPSDKEDIINSEPPPPPQLPPKRIEEEDDSCTPSCSTSLTVATLPPPSEQQPRNSSSWSDRGKYNEEEEGGQGSGGGKDDHSDGRNEDTCNPMVSDIEELEENADALRGDRIGATTYSERHVLKLLMKWVQELPKYSVGGEVKEEDASSSSANGTPLDRTRFLENDFEEEMALLWDMSFEPDVMSFLVEHNLFNIIRQTLEISNCSRLTEISLGIMANILSQQGIIEDFSIHDASLKLVETVVSQTVRMPNVPVLIQVFAVLRRITWFLRSVAIVQKWMDLLLSQKFLDCANFILSSCINVLLLGNVIVTLFTILETLDPEGEYGDDPEDKEGDEGKRGEGGETQSANFFGKALQDRKKDFESYRPFCETNFVPSLCEGLTELLKDPKPRKTQKLTSTRRDLGGGTGGDDEPGLDDELPIPDGLVQTAILNGLSAFFFLMKTQNGKDKLREHLSSVEKFILDFLRKYSLCTDAIGFSSGLDYFALAINILTFSIKEQNEIREESLTIPISIASKLMEEEQEEEKLKRGDNSNAATPPTSTTTSGGGEIKPENDASTFIALVIHEYLASLADTFGEGHQVFNVKAKYSTFFKFVETLVNKVSEENERIKMDKEEKRDPSQGQGQSV